MMIVCEFLVGGILSSSAMHTAMNGDAQHMLKEALCGEAGASSPRVPSTLADACWVMRVGWKIGVLLCRDVDYFDGSSPASPGLIKNLNLCTNESQ